jgi:hypothetical protein
LHHGIGKERVTCHVELRGAEGGMNGIERGRMDVLYSEVEIVL